MNLTELFTQHYGLSGVTLSPAPRGFVAETWYVATPSMRYFAKLIRRSPDSDILEHSLPLLHELYALGVECICYPIPTTDGQFSLHSDGQVVALFNCIDAPWTLDYPLELYVPLLAQIHLLSGRLQTPLARETFDLPFKADLLAYLDQLWSGTFNGVQEQRLQTWARTRREEITRDFAIIEQAVEQLKRAETPFILTHGDAPGNILYDGTQVYLVDWDMVLLAPRERDTWFHRHTEGFLSLYRQHVPGYNFDPLHCRFYLYKRYFEDLLGYVDHILSPHRTDEQKAHDFDELVKTCDIWLRPLMDTDRTET